MTDNKPLTSADCDLRDFPFMPLDVVRLRDADITALSTGDEFRCAVMLWCASWHQVPAASLPDDDIVLANLAGFGRVVREWKKVREGALRGWVKCGDGRLYHPVVAEKASEAWKSKLKHHYEKLVDRLRKENKKREAEKLPLIPCPTIDQWIADGKPSKYDPEEPRKPGSVPAESGDDSGGNPEENSLKGKGQGYGEGQGSNSFSEQSAAAANGGKGQNPADSPPPASCPSDENQKPTAEAIADLLTGLEAARGKKARFARAHDTFAAWVAQGATLDVVRAAHQLAVMARQRDSDQAALNAAFVACFIGEAIRDAAEGATRISDGQCERFAALRQRAGGKTFQGPDGRVFEVSPDGAGALILADGAVRGSVSGPAMLRFLDDVEAGVLKEVCDGGLVR